MLGAVCLSAVSVYSACLDLSCPSAEPEEEPEHKTKIPVDKLEESCGYSYSR